MSFTAYDGRVYETFHHFVCTAIYHNPNARDKNGMDGGMFLGNIHKYEDITFVFSCMSSGCKAHFRFVVNSLRSEPRHIAYMLEHGEFAANREHPCPALDHGAVDRPKTLAEVFGEEVRVNFVAPGTGEVTI